MSEFKCEECNREFDSQQALDMHNEHKHGIKIKKEENKETAKENKSKKNKKYLLMVVLLVIAIVAAGYWLSQNNTNYDSFAQCLSEKNATMYGTWWCPHCKDQKKLFGNSFQYINYVECSSPGRYDFLPVCESAGIDGYPSWVFNNGEKRGGLIPLEELAQITNCTIEN